MCPSVRRCMLAALLFVPSVAAAQEPGDVGVFMGYPNLGLIWQTSDKVALRPEISFGYTTVDTGTGSVVVKSHSWNIGFGATALVYLNDSDKLRTYVGPRFTYTHSDSSSSAIPVGSDSNAYLIAGMFGAQYSLNERFSVFGELGFGYSHSSNDNELTGSTNKINSFSTRSGVGAILYF